MSKVLFYSYTEILSISDTYLTFNPYFIAFAHYFYKFVKNEPYQKIFSKSV